MPGEITLIGIALGGRCPGVNYPRNKLWWCKYLRTICPGGIRPRGSCPGTIQENYFSGIIVLGGNCLWGNCLGSNSPGGIFRVAIVQWGIFLLPSHQISILHLLKSLLAVLKIWHMSKHQVAPQ